MSGPKEGLWWFLHDPAEQRLADLEEYCARLDEWLARQRPFLRQHLGERGVREAERARRAVEECIENGDPDGGFDSYGDCWATFNALWRSAAQARSVERQRLARERQERQTQAAAILRECVAAWRDEDSRSLLERWGDRKQREAFQVSLAELRAAGPERVIARGHAWLDKHERLIATAEAAAAENSRQVQGFAPTLAASLRAMSEPDLSFLAREESGALSARRDALGKQSQDALGCEDMTRLLSLHREIDEFTKLSLAKVRAAQAARAAGVWQDALAKLGYTVRVRRDPDTGTSVVEARAFPRRSVKVEFSGDTDKARLNVNGEYDSTQCVGDMQAIQAALAELGMGFKVTNWGRARPGASALRTLPLQRQRAQA